MTRLSPVQHRPHHTWPGGLGGIAPALALALPLALLSLGAGCSRVSPEQPATGDIAPAAPAPDIPSASADPQILPIPSPADTLTAAHRQIQAQARRLPVPADPVAVDLYTPDAACAGYQTEAIQVPRHRSMENTVAWIVAEQTLPQFVLSGYRTSFDPDTKTVTIDLRVARTSPRSLRSLSICEQKLLLGSLRQTLLNQPDWQLQNVIFTDRGNPLVL